jgi:choice-of-anchor A domain-containing protein
MLNAKIFVFFIFSFLLYLPQNLNSQSTCDFGDLRQYNVISRTGADIWNSDIEGRSVFGGTLRSGNYSYGLGLPANSSPSVQVAGNIDIPGGSTNIQTYNGNVHITGSVVGGGFVGTNGYSLLTGQAGIPLNLTTAFTLLQNRSTTWSGLAATGSVSVAGGIVTLNGFNATGTVVFNLTAGTHTSTNIINSGIWKYTFVGCANAQSVLINVSGTNIRFSGGTFETYPPGNKIVWNFHQATQLEITNWGFKGTVLARLASFNFNFAHVDGHIFVNYLSGSNGEAHNRTFVGSIGTCTPPTVSNRQAVCNITTPCSGGNDAMSMPGFYNNGTAGANYRLLSGEFIEYPDGTAVFYGRVENVNDPNIDLDISMSFSGRTTTPGPGNPWNPNGCTPPASGWVYYANMGGSFVGISGTVTEPVIGYFNKTGTNHVQIGVGATGSNATLFGIGATFNGVVLASGGQPVSNFSNGVLDWIYCTQPCSMTVSVGSNSPLCTGATLQLTSTPLSGLSPYTYSWNGPTSFAPTVQNPTRTNVTTTHTGIYAVTVTGANGCTATASTTVSIQNTPTVSISTANNQVCTGGSVSLVATPAGGVGVCTLQWQSSPNGTTWTNISGATSNTYNTPALSANTQYRAIYSCSGTGCCN